MSERWLMLLNNLTQRLLEEPAILEDPQAVIEEFAGEGFQPGEIEAALAWIGRFIAEPAHASVWQAEPFTSNGLRARSLEEQLSFSPEAFGFLMRLENSGIIDATQREEILERALGTFEEEIGEEEIRSVCRLVLQDHGFTPVDADDDPLDLLDERRQRH